MKVNEIIVEMSYINKRKLKGTETNADIVDRIGGAGGWSAKGRGSVGSRGSGYPSTTLKRRQKVKDQKAKERMDKEAKEMKQKGEKQKADRDKEFNQKMNKLNKRLYGDTN